MPFFLYRALALAALFLVGCTPATLSDDLTPPLPTSHLIAPGVECYQVTLIVHGEPEQVWITLPKKRNPPKLPIILIAAAGSHLVDGKPLAEGDRAEHIPYAQAGMAVVAYSIPGEWSDHPNDSEIVEKGREFYEVKLGMDNAKAALNYALAKVVSLDKSRIYAVGHSSAATLALQYTSADPRIKAVFAYAPCTDVEKRVGTELEGALNRAIPGFAVRLHENSPINLVNRIKVPTLVFHADDDSVIPASDNARFANALSRVNPHVTFVRVPSGDHYDNMIQQGIPLGIRWIQKFR